MKENTYANGLILTCENGHKWESAAEERMAKISVCCRVVSPIAENPKCPECGEWFEGFKKKEVTLCGQ